MKKAIMFVGMLVMVGGLYMASQPSTYTKECSVVWVSGDVVTVKDLTSGEDFSFHGDGFKKYQLVDVTFNDCGTDEIYDDEIVDVVKHESEVR